MTYNESEFCDWLSDASRYFEKECDKMNEKLQEMEEYRKAFEIAETLLEENKRQKAENEDLRDRLQQMEMQLNEMSKFSAVMAKKSSEDDVIKFIRVFVNKSKQKTIKKRTLIKEMVLEFTYANGIVLPDDLMAAIYALDDEQPEPSVTVNVAAGGINVQQANTVKK